MCLGLADATVSMWVIGRDTIPPARYRQLLVLCREAHAEALRVIAAAATRPNKTAIESVAVNAYAERVARAGQLLQQLEQVHGYQA